MIFTPRIYLLVAAIVFGSVLLQLSFFSQMPLLGSVINIVPVAIISLGLLGGPVPGAVSGFAAGLLLDAALGSTLGVSSLSLMAAGYLAGRWRETYDIVSSLVPPLLAGLLTGVAVTAFAAIQLMLGVEATISILVVREILVQSLLAMLIAIPLFPLIRRILRPALVDDARPRTGRASRRASRGGILKVTGPGEVS